MQSMQFFSLKVFEVCNNILCQSIHQIILVEEFIKALLKEQNKKLGLNVFNFISYIIFIICHMPLDFSAFCINILQILCTYFSHC